MYVEVVTVVFKTGEILLNHSYYYYIHMLVIYIMPVYKHIARLIIGTVKEELLLLSSLLILILVLLETNCYRIHCIAMVFHVVTCNYCRSVIGIRRKIPMGG